MKYLILILLFLFHVYLSVSVRGTLRKARPYQLLFDSAPVVISSRFATGSCELKVVEGHEPVADCSFNLTSELPLGTKITLQGYEKREEEFKETAMVVKMPLCWGFINDKYFFADIAKLGNFPTECPVMKGFYYFKNYRVDESKLPPYLPGEKWRFDVTLESRNEIIVQTKWMLRVVNSTH